MKMYRLWLSAAGVALISAAGSAHALVFSAVTQSPPPGYQLTAAGQAAGTPPVTVTYTPTPTQGTLWNPNPFAADTFFNFNVDPGGNLVPTNTADNTFGATFFGQPGGTATYTFSQPVVGDAATGLTQLTTLNTMQHASFQFTLQGGAVWTAANLLPPPGSCTPPAQMHGLTTVSGLGTPVLTFTRPVGSSAEGCDDYALVALAPSPRSRSPPLRRSTPASASLSTRRFAHVSPRWCRRPRRRRAAWRRCRRCMARALPRWPA